MLLAQTRMSKNHTYQRSEKSFGVVNLQPTQAEISETSLNSLNQAGEF